MRMMVTIGGLRNLDEHILVFNTALDLIGIESPIQNLREGLDEWLPCFFSQQ